MLYTFSVYTSYIILVANKEMSNDYSQRLNHKDRPRPLPIFYGQIASK